MSVVSAAERPSLAGMKYLVEDVLCSDEQGKVLRIGDKATGKIYALKLVNRDGPADDAKLARCRASAEASTKLGHAAILKCHDFREKRAWFRVVRGELLMENVNGRSLEKLPREPSAGQWFLIFKQVAEALAHMHRRGVLHGDITPGRVLLAYNGSVKVIGYGQSLLEDKAHRTAAKNFAAPEQLRDRTIDERTEIYAFGAMMYFLLTGKTPNALRNKADDQAVKVPPPSALGKNVPRAVDDLIVKCVQRHPPNRPAGMFEVFKGLEGLVASMKLDNEALKALSIPAET